MKNVIFIFATILFISSCDAPKKINYSSVPIHLKDISYGSLPSSKMDVSIPAFANEHTPFVIIIHGGAWVLGDKIWGERSQDTLLQHGIASANINYRFADDEHTHLTKMLEDVDSAIQYCINHAREWHTRKEGFTMNGESAGAHMALMYAYTTKRKINAIVSECAPTNLTDTTVLNYYLHGDTALLHAFCKMAGSKYIYGKSLPKAFTEASPVYHVNKIPVLFFHGTADVIVPFSQAKDLEKN